MTKRPPKESFDERFMRFLEERGLNRGSFARLAYEQTGRWIPPESQRNWKGDKKPLPDTIEAIADVLGLSVDAVLGREVNETNQTESAERRRKRAADEDGGEVSSENG